MNNLKMIEQQDYWKGETVAFYALQSIRGVGFRTLYKIAVQKMSFASLIKCDDPKHFEKTLRIKLPEQVFNSVENWDSYKKEAWAYGNTLARDYAKQDIKVIFYGQDAFPTRLKTITEPPMWLFVQGSIPNLHGKCIAIIGSRKASEDGYWLTKHVVASMAGTDVVSVSGLAEGIDQKAHEESLRFKVPTVAVLGTGIDSNYPKGSDEVRARILAQGGTIVTEYLVGQSYSAQNFVQRNRIQAGLSQVVVPVEWKIKSGTAHTVNFTKEFNRFLAMPYLPDTEINSPEIQAITSYSKGQAFNIPYQTRDFIEFLKDPKEQENDNQSPISDLPDGERQFSLL